MNAADGQAEAGFTLLETLAAVVAMAAIVSGIALVTGQWLPTWRHGFADLQRAGAIGQGLDRLAADFAAAEYIRLDALALGPLFDGAPHSTTFVRASLGPNAAPGLEVVRYAEVADAHGLAMVRTQAPFRPGERNPAFSGPVVVAHAPFRITFAYAGDNNAWLDVWPSGGRLPSAVRITVRDAASGAPLAASTANLLHVTAPAPNGGGGANAKKQE